MTVEENQLGGTNSCVVKRAALLEKHCDGGHFVLSSYYIRPTGVGRLDDRGPMPKAWGFAFLGSGT